jgi:hypothetical protein
MIQKNCQFLKFVTIKICLIAIIFMSLPNDAMAASGQCVVFTNGQELPGPKYPDHPERSGHYFYVGDSREDIFSSSVCGGTPVPGIITKLTKLQNQINDAYLTFAGCEENKIKNNCEDNLTSPMLVRRYFVGMESTCGVGFADIIKYGRFYYCAGGGMMERTDFIPVVGCAPNTYAATSNCQPCPNGKYSPKGSTNVSQCVGAESNEAVWAISKSDENGFLSCSNASFNGDGNCSCRKGANWNKQKNQCE